jgi:CheY-like chemotaxis protein
MGRTDNLPSPVLEKREPVILLVEDDVLIRISLSDHLQNCGFRVFEVGSAVEAIEMIEHSPIEIDFVVSDVRMPGKLDGFGLSRWIKANRPDLPIALASAEISKANLADELCAHERFFTKPYDAVQVEAHVREALAKRR